MRCAECARVSWMLCRVFDLVISMSLSQPYQAAMLAAPSSAVGKQIFHCVWAPTSRASYSSTPPPEVTGSLTHWWSERSSWLGKRGGRAFKRWWVNTGSSALAAFPRAAILDLLCFHTLLYKWEIVPPKPAGLL